MLAFVQDSYIVIVCRERERCLWVGQRAFRLLACACDAVEGDDDNAAVNDDMLHTLAGIVACVPA